MFGVCMYVFNFDFAVGVLQILRDIHTDYNKSFSNYTGAKCIYLYLLTAVNPVTARLLKWGRAII